MPVKDFDNKTNTRNVRTGGTVLNRRHLLLCISID